MEQAKFIERANELLKQKQSKVDYEFQEICLELEKVIGKVAWKLPHEEGNTDFILRKAMKEFEKRKFPYFKWLINQIKSGKIR